MALGTGPKFGPNLDLEKFLPVCKIYELLHEKSNNLGFAPCKDSGWYQSPLSA